MSETEKIPTPKPQVHMLTIAQPQYIMSPKSLGARVITHFKLYFLSVVAWLFFHIISLRD